MTKLGELHEFCWMDLKTYDIAGTATFFSAVLNWRFEVDEDDWRRTTKITVDGHQIGTVSDLANPIYPPGTPAHIAYYIRVDDVDHRVEVGTLNGAQLVLAPFDAGGQGRVATLIDPAGAVFSLWQADRFSGWRAPPNTAYAPQRMVLTGDRPRQAEDFYRRVLGTGFRCCDFLTAASVSGGGAPQWELAIGATDLQKVAARVLDHGGMYAWSEHAERPSLCLSSPHGLTLQILRLND
ncbi:VOC family protein [Streptosporangium saharense]|uniref:VOC family protein n=1 Tax=Streptosporangium saharense TaxID=1706840 RepID=UPI00332D24D5